MVTNSPVTPALRYYTLVQITIWCNVGKLSNNVGNVYTTVCGNLEVVVCGAVELDRVTLIY